MKDKIAEWWGRKGAKKEDEVITFKPYEEPGEMRMPPETEREKLRENEAAKGSSIELKVVRPESYEEVATVADYLLEGYTVFLNFELLDKPMVRRMLDFLSGVTYAKDGQIKQTSATTYVITPDDVDITDDKN